MPPWVAPSVLPAVPESLAASLTLEVVIRVRLVVAFGLAACAGLRPTPSLAQDNRSRSNELVWQLEDLRSGFCVQLLVDSGTVARGLPPDLHPVRADQVPDLHPTLRIVVQNQPEYGSWIPSKLCLYYFAGVDAGAARVQSKDSRKAPLLAAWTAAAAEVGSGARRDVALEFVSGSGRLSRAAQRAGVNMIEAHSVIGMVPFVSEEGVPSSDSRYQLKIGKTLITWDGRAVGDSTRVDKPIEADWLARGRRSETSRRTDWWHARLLLAPAWSRGMAGSLRVQGKDDFAQALKASPIRFVGPVFSEGRGELHFER
jgi:hypothetical protein